MTKKKMKMKIVLSTASRVLRDLLLPIASRDAPTSARRQGNCGQVDKASCQSHLTLGEQGRRSTFIPLPWPIEYRVRNR